MKIKKLLSLLAATTMAVTALTSAMSVSASEVANGTCGDGITWTLDSDGKLTISGKGEMASPDNLDINAEPSDYSDIYTYKQEHMEDIKEVVIDEGITSIGFAAFYKMPNLVTVTLPTTISNYSGAPRATTAVPEYDGYNYAFAECTSLKNLTLPEDMTAIGAYTFYKCTALESVHIPSSIKIWGYHSFEQCSSLKDITLPEGLTVIGGSAFSGTAVESIVIPSTITVWEVILHRDRGLPGLETHSGYAFSDCQKLTSVTFTDGIKTIANKPFYNCKSLKKVVVPASVTNLIYGLSCIPGLEEAYIENGAQISLYNGGGNSYFDHSFDYCENLKKIEIPEGVATQSNYSWCTGCSSLTDVYIHNRDIRTYFQMANETLKVHCYFDTTTYKTLTDQYKNNLPSDRILNIEDDISTYLDIVKTRLETANKYDEEKYTPESYAVLKAIIEKAVTFNENSSVLDMQWAAEDLETAIKGLEKKPPEDNTSGKESDSSNSQQQIPNKNSQQQTPNKTTPNTPTTARPTKATRSAAQVKKDKSAAKKAMKQAKITKLTAKSKAKKKITVSWKKVKNAKGYQVQVSAKKDFKKVIYNKSLTKNKLTIKSSKIKSKKTYYVRVRAYATYKDANNATKKIYSKWVKKIRKVKVK